MSSPMPFYPDMCPICFEPCPDTECATGIDTLSPNREFGTWRIHRGQCALDAGIKEAEE
jgi:hypothetical protein